jgi:hypothetical protein
MYFTLIKNMHLFLISMRELVHNFYNEVLEIA